MDDPDMATGKETFIIASTCVMHTILQVVTPFIDNRAFQSFGVRSWELHAIQLQQYAMGFNEQTAAVVLSRRICKTLKQIGN